MESDLEKQRDFLTESIIEHYKIEAAQINVLVEQKRLQEKLEKALHAQQEIEKLKPLIAEQELLEKIRDDFIEQMAQIRAKEAEVKRLDEKMNDLRGKFIKNKEQIREAAAKAETAGSFENLQKRDSELTREITRLSAKLEFNEQFQSEVKNGLCPIPLLKCLNLKPSETLKGFLKNQFVELKAEIEALEAEHKSLADALSLAREAEKFSAALATLKSRAEEIAEEGTSYKTEKENLSKEIGDMSKIQNDLAKAEAKLKDLANPKAHVSLLEKEIKQEMPIREKLSEIERNLERLESDKRINAEQMESYKRIDVEGNCNVGSNCLRLAELLFSLKNCREVFYQIVADWREDYLNALRKGRMFDAVFISAKYYSKFTYTIVIYSRFGRLIEFVMKIVEVIEFLSKFFNK